jgi:hypothetical protein
LPGAEVTKKSITPRERRLGEQLLGKGERQVSLQMRSVKLKP